MTTNPTRELIKLGMIEGIKMYAFWKDGKQYVGTCGTTLDKAIEDIKNEATPYDKMIINSLVSESIKPK